MATQDTINEVFAVDFALLAREIAMDIFPLEDIIRLHQLSDVEWTRLSENRKFQEMIASMAREWEGALNTRERIKVKAQTALEAQLEIYVRDIADPSIPLAQRVEAGKFLARLGEMDGGKGDGSGQFVISLNIGDRRDIAVVPGTTLTEKLIRGDIVDVD